VKYLLDTSVWLWTLAASERIGPQGREVLDPPGGEFYLSAASSWEIGIKSALGKLELPGPAVSYVPERMAAQGIRQLPITHTHALAVSELPPFHRDPFDRLLIAQAQIEGMAVLAADQAFRPYPVELVWCGG